MVIYVFFGRFYMRKPIFSNLVKKKNLCVIRNTEIQDRNVNKNKNGSGSANKFFGDTLFWLLITFLVGITYAHVEKSRIGGGGPGDRSGFS